MPSPSRTIGIKGKVIHSQGREIIANVLQFMQQESLNNAPVIPLNRFKERLLAATGISDRVYRSIVNEAKDIKVGKCTTFSSPHKNTHRSKPKSDLRESEIETIRTIIHNFYIHEKRRPTLQGIYNKIRENGVEFEGGLTTFSKIIKKMGFKWQKTADKRKVLMETYDIRGKRIQYLKQLQNYIHDKRPIIFTDESYIHSTHTQPKEWSDASVQGLKKPISKGTRLIMVHAGGKMGFVPNALLLFKSGAKSGDYHNEMNSTNFFTWVEKQLLPNLPPRSVLVIDNAAYHNVKLERTPTSVARKGVMVEWLVKRNIFVDMKQKKPELYELIKQHKSERPKYKLDTLLWAHNHNVLRLPPYHPDLNPIEKIWAIVKNWVAARNTTFKLADVEALTREKFAAVTPEEWAHVCNHVDKVVEDYMHREQLIDDFMEEIEFTVNTGESDEEHSDTDFEDDEDLGV